MHATPSSAAVSTVAIDLAKDVFELALAETINGLYKAEVAYYRQQNECAIAA